VNGPFFIAKDSFTYKAEMESEKSVGIITKESKNDI
jgi:hypothetical protein